MKQKLCFALCLFFMLSSYAEVIPQSLSGNRHIQVASYNPNAIYRVNTMQGFITAIQFGENENVISVNIGDSSSWLVNVQSDVVNIKPIADDPDTNMNVLTTRGMYQFFLTAPPLVLDASGKISRLPESNTVFLLRFRYPDDSKQALQSQPSAKYASENWHYTARGDADTVPICVFDDGQFTFFDFGHTKDIPAIFTVDAKGHEAMINFHVQGKYVVVEALNKQFTLRNGNKVANIFNEAAR